MPSGVVLFGNVDIYKEKGQADIYVILSDTDKTYEHAMATTLAKVKQHVQMDRGTIMKSGFMERIRRMEHSLPRRRSKRSPFDFVGDISKSLFGTATVGDVRKLAKAINTMGRAFLD